MAKKSDKVADVVSTPNSTTAPEKVNTTKKRAKASPILSAQKDKQNAISTSSVLSAQKDKQNAISASPILSAQKDKQNAISTSSALSAQKDKQNAISTSSALSVQKDKQNAISATNTIENISQNALVIPQKKKGKKNLSDTTEQVQPIANISKDNSTQNIDNVNAVQKVASAKTIQKTRKSVTVQKIDDNIIQSVASVDIIQKTTDDNNVQKTTKVKISNIKIEENQSADDEVASDIIVTDGEIMPTSTPKRRRKRSVEISSLEASVSETTKDGATQRDLAMLSVDINIEQADNSNEGKLNGSLLSSSSGDKSNDTANMSGGVLLDIDEGNEKGKKPKKEKKIKPVKIKEVKKKKIKMKNLPPIVRVDSDPDFGLSSAEVEARINTGNTNAQPNVITKSYFKIFRTNVFTLFNIINFFLATLILIYGEFKNALFIGIATVNMIVGIVQEIRSKLALEKMSILTSPVVDVIRDGETKEISTEDIVLDDMIILKQGGQIPADCVLVRGDCEVNESLLTGEQDDVHKQPGSQLLSGSFIQAGTCHARVQAVGANSFTSKLMAEAKKFKKPKSELMKSINWIIRIVTILIFPVGILMFFTNLNTTPTINAAITATVASIVGMIPEGLVMLTSVALAVGIVRLARKRTLVQDLYCIETLARVDVLCLDKTGTITEGSMEVEQTHIYSTKNGFVDDIMANMVNALGEGGATFSAFKQYFHSEIKYQTVKTIPFSSSRKWSGADFGADGRYIVGAPEFVLKSRYNTVAGDATEFTKQGYRVLVLVKTTEMLKETMDENKMKPIALIVLSDKIRENAAETFEYFAQQGVTLKVISGDNAITVSKVAERAGLKGADKYIDASVDLDTPEKIYDACDKYTIFGRVSPKQKKMLVSALKAKGFTVGMTGDGVNDVMALKEADCSIAMASGSEASRNVSQLVLLDSDFSALPSVVAEGRRVINNIERAASLFLVKTTFSIVLSLILIIFQMNYPFVPIQLSLISALFVGVPSFFLALEPNDRKVSGNFLGKVIKKALPAGLTVAVMLFIVSYMYKDIGVDVTAQISTMSFYITSMVAILVLMQVSFPYNKETLFLVAMCVIVFIMCVTSTWISGILSLVPLTTDMIIKLVIMLAVTLPMILFMRAEVEAFRMLYKEVRDFCVKTYTKTKQFFKNKKDLI